MSWRLKDVPRSSKPVCILIGIVLNKVPFSEQLLREYQLYSTEPIESNKEDEQPKKTFAERKSLSSKR
jgi:hypothetical protein